MSKKMWQKIFKSKNKNAKNKNDNLKRCSIYEEFQQLNGLQDINPKKVLNSTSTTKTDENQIEKRSVYEFDLKNEQENLSSKIPTNQTQIQVEYDEKPLPTAASRTANVSPQSTFSKVVNTLTLNKRNNQTRKLEIENEQKNIKNITSTPSSSSSSKSSKKKSSTTSSPSITKTKNNSPTNESKLASNEFAEDEEPTTDLAPCPICSRKFNTVSLSKHVNICQKMTTKKRKPFDSSRQRREGTELAAYLPKNFGLPANKQTPENLPADEKFTRSTARSSMRKQSNASTVSNVSVNTTASTTSMPTSPKPTALSLARSRHNSTERPKRGKPTPPSSEQCPHCERFFGIKAYDRHVEWCKEKSIQAAIKNSSSSQKDKAKERLVARTQYRAPIKTKRSLNREKYAGVAGEEYEGDENLKINSNNALMTSSVASDSALINSSYDPFLAAKRQLEELCAPDSPPNNDTRFDTKTLSTPTTPSPILPSSKMTTSLTLGSTITLPTPTLSSPLTPNLNVRRLNNATTPTATNFRRTSSLRGPRRSPLLPARPLFAQKRPTIQRGLSDEGPISTNFLKSEEYDEIPVRSVCVNDFAITNSPRVVRRDTSLSNRKNSLKLSFNNNGVREAPPSGGSGGDSGAGVGMAVSSDERLTTLNPPKELSKTDSLAVFLKYEKELEKLANVKSNADVIQFQWDSDGDGSKRNTVQEKVSQNCAVDTKSKATQPQPETLQPKLEAFSTANSVDTATSILAITKELKDKSNTLSKQNSAKSLKLENETVECNKPAQKESPKLSQERYELNKQQIRLEPIERNTQIPQPVNNQLNTKRPQTSLPPLTQQASVTSPTVQTVNLELIFNKSKPQQQQQLSQPPTSSSFSTYDKEIKAISSSTEYIDPKLINKCDNLPVKLADLKFVDSDSSTEQQQQQQHCDRATDPYERYVAPISQLSKLLPLSNKTNPPSSFMRNAQAQSNPKHTKATATSTVTQQQPISNSQQQQPQAVVSNNHTNNNGTQRRNSIESNISTNCRNPLKRKMRLGRNQFLYDASPEALDIDSACSADDEANPRSSAEYSPQIHSTFEQMMHLQAPHFQNNAIAPPPVFDDFDFDEFLSSFENDEEDFPLFRDCREFLKNRNSTTNKQQQRTPTTNRNASTPKQIPQTYINNSNNNNNSSNFFQFPTLDRNLPHLVAPTNSSSTRRSNSKHSIQGLKDMLMNDTTMTTTTKANDFYGDRSMNSHPNACLQRRALDVEHDDDDDDDVIAGNAFDNSQKREIFISIETEQSDDLLDRNPISPNSLRNMVGGNPQTLVEVEVDAKDNKFSKISDDDDNNNGNNNNAEIAEKDKCAAQTSARNLRLLPNVQFNNAKNLMQQTSNTEKRDDHHQQQQRLHHSQNPASGISAGDSDEMSSLDGYPLDSAGSFRRSANVGSKTSADSAYGSLSRQRSNETMGKPVPARNSSRTRPATAAADMTNGNNSNSAAAAAHMQQKQFLLQQQFQKQQQQMLQQQQQQQLKYAQAMMKGARSRQLSASSSSSSDNSLPPILVANPNHFQQQQQLLMQQQQQQQMSQLYQHNKARSRTSPTPNYATTLDLMNANHPGMMLNSNALTTMASSTSGAGTSKPMSRFCHECGSKFLIDQAKFCMDCGVKRLMI